MTYIRRPSSQTDDGGISKPRRVRRGTFQTRSLAPLVLPGKPVEISVGRRAPAIYCESCGRKPQACTCEGDA